MTPREEEKEQVERITDKKRRATLTSISPVIDSPKCATEIEQEAFDKIKQWQSNFASKLETILSQQRSRVDRQQTETLSKKRRATETDIPTGLDDDQIRQMRRKLIAEELRRKSLESEDDREESTALFRLR